MRDPIGDVPDGYAVHRVGDTWLVLERGHASDLVQLRLADASVRAALFARGPRRGRGRTPSVALAGGARMVLRRYRHGGLFGALTRALLLGPQRALAELRVSAAARDAGAPVPPVLCLVLWPVLGPLWSGVIGTLEVPAAREAGAWLGASATRAARIELARQVGEAVRALHDAGVEHRDLQLGNILVSSESPRVVLVDLDRAIFHAGEVPLSRRAQNLGRLVRSAHKTGLWRARVGPRERAAFAAGYARGDRTLRSQLLGYIPRERCKLAAHRLSWWFRMPRPPSQPAAAPPRPA
jgi:3-deoxy-D-manno-octulosonic acid kinase